MTPPQSPDLAGVDVEKLRAAASTAFRDLCDMKKMYPHKEVEEFHRLANPDAVMRLIDRLAAAEAQVANFLSYGQGGASFKESQLLEQLAASEKRAGEYRKALELIVRDYSYSNGGAPNNALACVLNIAREALAQPRGQEGA